MAVPHPNVVVPNAMAELQFWQQVVIEDDRQEYLEWIYKLDGRDKESHPLHSVYTGLAEKYKGIFSV
jgi:hypothetical protein